MAGLNGLTPICRRPLTEVGRRGLGGCWRVQISSKMVPRWLQNGSKIDPGASWRALGAVLAAWSALGGLLERCWSALGSLRGRKKDLLSGSWASKRNLKTGFSHLGDQKVPKRVPKGVPKRGPKAIQAQKHIALLQTQRHFDASLHRSNIVRTSSRETWILSTRQKNTMWVSVHARCYCVSFYFRQ